MAENPYLALVGSQQDEPPAAENPYMALTKPADDPLAPRAAVPNRADFSDVLGGSDVVTPERPGFLSVLGSAIDRGATSGFAGTLHAGADLVDQTVQRAIAPIGQLLGHAPDPLGAEALAEESLGVEREIGLDRAAAAQAIGGRPSLGEAIDNPLGAAGQYGLHLANVGGESLPIMAAAIATRNPELASGVLGAVTGAQEYTGLRGQGVGRADAAQAGALSGLIEAGGESVGLPLVMGRGGGLGGFVRAAAAEGAQEVPVTIGQQLVQDQATGRETPVSQQLGDALDAFLVGSGIGAGGHGLSVATDALGSFPNAAPRQPEAPQTPAIDPAVLAAGNAALGAAPAPVVPAAAPVAPLGQAEDTSDIDALLSANVPPDVAAQAQEVAATATPEQQQAAMQVLGELLDPSPAAPPEPALTPAVPASQPAGGAAATNFMQQAAASMRMRSQEQAARTAAPAAQSPAAPVGSRSAGGDLAPAPADTAIVGGAIKRTITSDEVAAIKRGGARFNKPASEFVDVLYRDTSPEDIFQYVGLDQSSSPDVHWSNTPSQAIGQDGNSGLVVEMDASRVHGSPNISKPSWQQQFQQGNLEYVGFGRPAEYADGLISLTAQPDSLSAAKVIRAGQELEGRGFVRTENGDGSVTWRRGEAPAATAPPTAIDDTPDPPLNIRYGKPRLPPAKSDAAKRPAAATDGAPQELAHLWDANPGDPVRIAAGETGAFVARYTRKKDAVAAAAGRRVVPYIDTNGKDRWAVVEQAGRTNAESDDALENIEDFRGMKRADFLGNPRITSNSYAADLKPKALRELDGIQAEPFLDGRYTAKFSDGSGAVFDGDKVVASYNFGDTLVVDPAYRRQGIGEELVYQWRTRNPDRAYTRTRTRASQRLQEKVLSRIERELGDPLEQREIGQSAPTDTPPAGSDLADISRRMGEADAERLGLRAAVNEALGKVGEKVIFLRGYEGLPERQRRGIEARTDQRGGRGRTSALYDPQTKNVYVFTDVVRTPDRAVWNAAHEIAGHEGLRTLLGDKLDHALGIALQNPTVAAVADAIATERALRPNQRMLAAEEALAELAAAVRTGNFDEIANRYAVPVPEGIRERLTRAIENFLRRLKEAMDDIFGRHQFTDEDVRALLENAWQAVNLPANGELAPDLDGFDATAPDQTQTPEFRRWFGDSKVVGANGDPLVVYHGTAADFDTFDLSRAKSEGGAIFLSNSWPHRSPDANAKTYGGQGGRVIGAYVKMENPRIVGPDVQVTEQSTEEEIDEFLSAVETFNRSLDWSKEKWLAKEIATARRNGNDGVIVRHIEDDRTDYGRMDPTNLYIAFRPEQIKSATGNRGTFDPDSPSILESVEDASDRAEARRNAAAGTLPVARGSAGWNYDAGKWEGRAGQLNNTRAALQDKMLAWRDVQGQIAANLQAAIPDAQNVYRLENLMHGRVKEGIDRIEREQIKPLVEAMRAAGVEPATLEEYLYARHAQERNAQIAQINPAMPDGGSGMTNAEAAKILASADKATLDPLARRVDAIAKATRRRLLANGLITQEAFDAMEAQYEYYVPLRGKATAESEDFGGEGMAGRGLDSRGKPVRNALGRGAGNRAQNILGEVIGDAERSVILAEKARVGRAVMRIVLANPNPALWQVEPVNVERALDANGEVYEKVVTDWSDPSVVAVRHKGQLYRVQVNSVPLARALNNVGVDQIGKVTRMAGAVNRYFSAILTKYNPAFTPVNASRDALFGLTGLAAEHGEAAALDAALHYPQAARAAFRQARGTSGSGQWDTWAAEFAASGGKTGYVNMPSAEEIARKIGSGSLTSYSPTGLRRAASVVGEAVSVLNDAVENALRLSAYVTMRKRGMSQDAAAEYAKNLTVNFNRKGFDGSKLNAWFLFYNASIQGAHRVSKLARKPKTWGYLGALAAAQVIATLAAMGMEDDQGEPLWNKVPDYVKRRNLVIVTPDGGLITIPMPYGFNLFPYIAGRITEAVANGERGDKRASDGAAQLTADFIGSGLESFSPVPLDDGVAGLLPTLLRIPVNVWANRNDFGGRIRNEAPYAKSDVPRASMGKPDTLEVFKLASTGLNRLGGGDDLTPPPLSAFDLAPEDLEYLVKTFTGGPGRLVTDIATVGQKVTGGDYAQEADPKDIPILNRFRSNIDEQASQQAMFYDRRETIDRSLKRVRATFKAEGEQAAQALLDATPELNGAMFRRRKRDSENGKAGSVILVDGNPQIVAGAENRRRGTGRPHISNPPDLTVFAAYKLAEDAISSRNESVEAAYLNAPAGLTPNRERDAYIRTSNRIREAAQKDFNAAWVRDVVGAAE